MPMESDLIIIITKVSFRVLYNAAAVLHVCVCVGLLVVVPYGRCPLLLAVTTGLREPISPIVVISHHCFCVRTYV